MKPKKREPKKCEHEEVTRYLFPLEGIFCKKCWSWLKLVKGKDPRKVKK